MNSKLKACAAALFALAAYTAQADETPVIQFHTTIYDDYGESNDFSLVLGCTQEAVGKYIDVDCGFGSVEAELAIADYDTDNDESTGTFVSCRVSSDGIVKIYCDDPNWIDWIDFHGCYIDQITFNGTNGLVYVNLSHNELKSLDLSDITSIQALYITDNPFTDSPLVIGPKPYLTTLEMNYIGALSSSFNLSDYPNIVTVDAWATGGLDKIDPTGCPLLNKLSIDGTNVASIDVSKNERLQILNISDTRITDLDVSKNANLTQLYCSHESTVNPEYKIKKLDVTNNPKLFYLFCTGNDFTELDISKNTNLGSLTARKNRLTSIDVSNNPQLYCLNISDNYLNYANLPWPYVSLENTEEAMYSEYDYAQREMVVDKSCCVGKTIDFSKQVLRDHTDTQAVMYAISESDPTNPVLVPESVYSYDIKTGILKINEVYADSVYVEFSNTIFSEANMRTQKFKIKSESDYGKPSLMTTIITGVTSGSGLSFNVGIQGATAANPKTFYVDLGDGNLSTFTAKTSDASETNVMTIAKGNRFRIYTDDDVDISALAIKDITIYSIDLEQLRSLRELSLVNTKLSTIDMQWNRCLEKLDLSHNDLYYTNFTLVANNQSYGKNALTDVDLSYNSISGFEWNENYTVERFNISHNKLSSLALSKNTKIQSIDVSYNNFTEFSCADCSALTSLNIEGNNLTSITLPTENALTYLNLCNNKFTLATLPKHGNLTEQNYIYAPQADYTLPAKAPGISLAEQNINDATFFTWKYAADKTIVPSDHITCTGGNTWFASAYAGEKVYCEMRNSAFPAFKGDNVYKTTVIETAAMPENVVAQFVVAPATEAEKAANIDLNTNVTLTLTSATADNTIYIDWSGNGNLAQYVLGTSYTIFYPTVTEGATVTVYSYDVDDKITVFSLRNAKLSSFKIGEKSLSKMVLLNLTNAGLSEINVPNTSALGEIIWPGNNLTSFDFSKYPAATYVNLADNKLDNINLESIGNVEQLYLGGNNLTKASFGSSNKLWNLYLNDNALTEVDLSKLPKLQQLFLNGNKLTKVDFTNNPELRVVYANDNELEHIDVTKLKNLGMLGLSGNRFKFSTLPLESDIFPSGAIYTYDYSSQAKVDVESVEGVVDLSSEYKINGTKTVYTWMFEEPDYDSDGNLTNEVLYGPNNEYDEDPDYGLEGGITRFWEAQDHVVCVMTNTEFPDLALQTTMINTDAAGVDDITADGAQVYVDVIGSDVYAHGADGRTATLFSAAGTVVASAKVSDGVAKFAGIAPGVYVATIGNRPVKIVVK